MRRHFASALLGLLLAIGTVAGLSTVPVALSQAKSEQKEVKVWVKHEEQRIPLSGQPLVREDQTGQVHGRMHGPQGRQPTSLRKAVGVGLPITLRRGRGDVKPASRNAQTHATVGVRTERSVLPARVESRAVAVPIDSRTDTGEGGRIAATAIYVRNSTHRFFGDWSHTFLRVSWLPSKVPARKAPQKG